MPSRTGWKNRTAVVSGGSSGLGLSIARALGECGAHVILIGRDLVRLKQAEEQVLSAGSPSVTAVPLDVTCEDDRWQSLKAALSIQGCDLLINAVGKSDRGLIQQLGRTDLLQQLEVNVLASHATTRFCWEALLESKGCVVNISSLAGIIPGPCMGGYSMSKHALVGWHRQWKLESAESGVHFLLVSPGPIARQDNTDRYADLVASRGLDELVNKPGGGVSLRRIDPEELSCRILDAAASRTHELVVPGKARILAALYQLWPSFAEGIVRRKMKQ